MALLILHACRAWKVHKALNNLIGICKDGFCRHCSETVTVSPYMKGTHLGCPWRVGQDMHMPSHDKIVRKLIHRVPIEVMVEQRHLHSLRIYIVLPLQRGVIQADVMEPAHDVLADCCLPPTPLQHAPCQSS